ncbi:hypothetical protein PVAP13_5KG417407 [Panicum virgatum]|uniref:Uncharacterized protein n=1 Tax=Panicum virgatum TaxID=38727 RepID=A0A8T0SRS3_PANVG|nr:hypothetical protein PVAP13_5KG417407 [Panicum virgatum]
MSLIYSGPTFHPGPLNHATPSNPIHSPALSSPCAPPISCFPPPPSSAQSGSRLQISLMHMLIREGARPQRALALRSFRCSLPPSVWAPSATACPLGVGSFRCNLVSIERMAASTTGPGPD